MPTLRTGFRNNLLSPIRTTDSVLNFPLLVVMIEASLNIQADRKGNLRGHSSLELAPSLAWNKDGAMRVGRRNTAAGELEKKV